MQHNFPTTFCQPNQAEFSSPLSTSCAQSPTFSTWTDSQLPYTEKDGSFQHSCAAFCGDELALPSSNGISGQIEPWGYLCKLASTSSASLFPEKVTLYAPRFPQTHLCGWSNYKSYYCPVVKHDFITISNSYVWGLSSQSSCVKRQENFLPKCLCLAHSCFHPSLCSGWLGHSW